tara:strand:- start:88 stop:249 length:162 start_codon:yes stop_codon:yes gene_type:complete
MLSVLDIFVSIIDPTNVVSLASDVTADFGFSLVAGLKDPAVKSEDSIINTGAS